MEVLHPIRLFEGVGIPLHYKGLTYAYIGEYLHFRYPKFLMTLANVGTTKEQLCGSILFF